MGNEEMTVGSVPPDADVKYIKLEYLRKLTEWEYAKFSHDNRKYADIVGYSNLRITPEGDVVLVLGRLK
jgi:hypothetical protein